MDLVEWFDPYNKEHMAAYKHLQDTHGMWPKGFIPEGMSLGLGWQFVIMNKIADAWVKHVLEGGH